MTESVASGTIETDYYYERVAAALADLPKEARDELLEDLPAHFAEVIAEQGGPLVDRLGPPATYAAELRAAAGLDTGPDHGPPTGRRSPSTTSGWSPRCRSSTSAPAGVIGYPRATEFLRLLRPAWWIARAVAIVVLIFATDIVPADRFDDPIGWLFLAVAIIVSIRIGATGVPRLPRWIGFAGTAVAVVGVLFVIANAPSLLRQYTPQDYYATCGGPFAGVTNVFPVDERGRQLEHVTLYDQNGNPIQVGDYWRCTNGDGARRAYPLCLGTARPAPAPTAEPTDTRARLPGRDPDRDPTRDPGARQPRARRRPGPHDHGAEPRTEPVALASFG